MKALLPVLLFLFSSSLFSYEGAQTFIVKFYDKKVKVLAPRKYSSPLSVIVENKTMVSLRGKVIDGSGEVLSFLSIEPNESQSVEIKVKEHEKYYYVPISPAFQKVRLQTGKDSYEIPPKK